ncbi:UDP-N-acetylglucosamine diphosphorylase, partial [Acrasis kona]
STEERFHRQTKRFGDANQSQVLQYWGEISEDERIKLLDQLETLPVTSLEHLNEIYKHSIEEKKGTENINPFPNTEIAVLKSVDKENAKKWHDYGLSLIAQSKVGVLLLAGGQGTRLGSTLPKGMYDLKLGSKKTLFQLQAERILKLVKLAQEKVPGSNPVIHWYIMTSDFTGEVSSEFFKKHNFFGLDESTVHFFSQESLPCMSYPDGKIILESKSSVALAPNGNGGVYTSLKNTKMLQHMKDHGVEHIHSYCVDNILVKVADPTFIAYCIERNADVGSKVVAKRDAHEPVGVFAIKDGDYNVVEYSEITKQMAETIDPETNRLAFNAGNIANFYYKTEFLEYCADKMEKQEDYHIAKKKIPTVGNTSVDGIKLELFNFDVVPLTKKVALLEVARETDFSPLKNSPEAKSDNPQTCRQHLSEINKMYLEQAGAVVEGEVDEKNGLYCEISPLVSYEGEGLEALVKGKTIKLPYILE